VVLHFPIGALAAEPLVLQAEPVLLVAEPLVLHAEAVLLHAIPPESPPCISE